MFTKFDNIWQKYSFTNVVYSDIKIVNLCRRELSQQLQTSYAVVCSQLLATTLFQALQL